jgi:hypothetical protein
VTTGLWVFLVVMLANVIGLLLDLILYLFYGYYGTITYFVRTGCPLLGGVIVALQVIGAIGLVQHFLPKGG